MLPETQTRSYERAYQREKRARQVAEELLERRARELYEANRVIEDEHRKLRETYQQLNNAQAQLVQSEKMASVGQLAAGIAHEINNPIAFIRSNLSTLGDYFESMRVLMNSYREFVEQSESKTPEDKASALAALRALEEQEDIQFLLEDGADVLKESMIGTDRVTEIVQSLKNFSRVDRAELNEVNLNEGIASTLKIAWNELKYKCAVETNYGDVPLLVGNAGELNQVFLNLIINASQAVAEGGELVVSTYVRGDDVCFEVKDNGCGMPQDILSSIFDPFFTTKEVGEGTGLGLSISYAIVEKHGGNIEVESKEGEGTRFVVVLPLNKASTGEN